MKTKLYRRPIDISGHAFMYDLIGDIHGHADELMQLLELLGYKKTRGVYCHPARMAIFLGDFIDRGPQIRQTLEVVRPMIEEGKALAVVGNHELNALAYHTANPARAGEYLRQHTKMHTRQLDRTVEQLTAAELECYLKWFGTLPLFLDLDGVRAVHACWDQRSIGKIARSFDEHGGITTAFLQAAYDKTNDLFGSVNIVLKGKDAALPDGVSIPDKDGGVRTEISARWYLSPKGHTYQTYALQSDAIDCDWPLAESVVADASPYPADEKPVFCGHYWLSARRPAVLAANVACLDYSVAKGGLLCAYCWQGERKLRNDHFVWVNARSGGR